MTAADDEGSETGERGDGHDHARADPGGTASSRDGELRLSVPGMDCPSCAETVEGSVEGVEGVETVDPRVTTGTVTVTGEADRAAVVDAVERAGYEVSAAETTLSVPEMDCASCAETVGAALAGLEGVTEYDTRPATGTVAVSYDADRTDLAAITAAVEGAGYEVADATDGGGDLTLERSEVWTSRRALKTWAGAVALLAGLLVEFALPGLNATVVAVGAGEIAVADVLFLLAVAVAGQAIVRGGYRSLLARNLDIDLLMSAAIGGALTASVVFGEPLYLEAATLAVLFSVAELLEQYSMDRARDSLRELMELSPEEATVLREGEEVTVPVGDVRVGEHVVVRPGEKVPVDGRVTDGESPVNQAPVTGESVPVDKAEGDEVYAGTIVEGGFLQVAVTAKPGEDTLSRVVELVESAQAERTEREQFVERFAGYYTPLVVGFAVLVTLASPVVLGTTWATAVVHGLTLLVLSCPCALVISTPVTVVSGITSAARNGVLVKGGRHLEALGEVDAVAFDKTGTLTKGELTVTDVIPLNGNTEDDVLRCARGLEHRSEHPIGEAIVAEAEGGAVAASRQIEDFESLTGRGVRADLDGTPHFAGTTDLFEDLGFDLSHVHATNEGGVVTETARELCDRNNCLDLLEGTVPELQAEGKTVVLVGRVEPRSTETGSRTESGDRVEELEGIIAVADEVRPEARRAVERLRELGVERTVMLTGDNERTARAVAESVGVDEVRAELLPEQKVEAVERLEREGTVAMVGDGVNDAPALATATVGVAMGAAGTDTALETADVALMADDLSRLPYCYELARDANGVIRQNVWASLAIKAALAIGVPFGLVPIWLAVLAGDAGMTVGVTANASRLAGVRPENAGGD